MELILEDIQRALDAGASFAALASAVTLPEICGRCEQEDMFSTKGPNRGEAIFDRFVEAYLKDWDIGLTGADLANIRNGLSHRGQLTQRNTPLRYVFYPPQFGGRVHNNRVENANGDLLVLNIDLRKFCTDISNAVRGWLVANAENATVQRNLGNVLQTREGDFGTGIYIEGVHWVA